MAVESRDRAGMHAQSITFSEYILSKKRFGQDLQIIIFEKKFWRQQEQNRFMYNIFQIRFPKIFVALKNQQRLHA
ncbi:hypothetical protein [Flagellimonas marinaquae]